VIEYGYKRGCGCVCVGVGERACVGGWICIFGRMVHVGMCMCGVCVASFSPIATTVHVIPKCARFVYMCYPITLTSVPPFLPQVTS